MDTDPKRLLDRESLRVEYADVGENWRFFIGARFVNLGFFGTFTGALLGFLSTSSGDEVPAAGGPMLVLLAILGLLLTLAVIVIDHRCRVLFEAAYRRGDAIEQQLGIKGGQYQQLGRAGRSGERGVLVISHTKALMAIYVLGAALWLAVIVLRSCGTL
jgi:hypothetical protein